MYDLSIITINFNDKTGLKKTIESVVNQDLKNFEYIVIDGGSNDGSLDVINEYSNFIHYYVSESDNGIYNAMNKGLLKAKGNYVLFLNSGDTFYSNESLIYFEDFLLSKKYDIVYGNLCVIETNKNWIKSYPSQLTFHYFINDTLPFPSTIIRRDLFKDSGFFDENFKIVSDWKFFLRAICKNNALYFHIENPIVKFNLDGISSNNLDLVKKERETILQEEFLFLINEFRECQMNTSKIEDLRKSKRIQFLQKIKILNEF